MEIKKKTEKINIDKYHCCGVKYNFNKPKHTCSEINFNKKYARILQ